MITFNIVGKWVTFKVVGERARLLPEKLSASTGRELVTSNQPIFDRCRIEKQLPGMGESYEIEKIGC